MNKKLKRDNNIMMHPEIRVILLKMAFVVINRGVVNQGMNALTSRGCHMAYNYLYSY